MPRKKEKETYTDRIDKVGSRIHDVREVVKSLRDGKELTREDYEELIWTLTEMRGDLAELRTDLFMFGNLMRLFIEDATLHQ